MKEIYFCVDSSAYNHLMEIIGDEMAVFLYNYEETEHHINRGSSSIVTFSMAHFSFDLIEEGYDIYLCNKDNIVRIEPHMDLSGKGEPCKDLRFGHNIFKLFRAGVFDELIGFERRAMGE